MHEVLCVLNKSVLDTVDESMVTAELRPKANVDTMLANELKLAMM